MSNQSIGQTNEIAYWANGVIDNQKNRGIWSAAFNEMGTPLWQHHFSSGKQKTPLMQFTGRGNQSYMAQPLTPCTTIKTKAARIYFLSPSTPMENGKALSSSVRRAMIAPYSALWD